MARKLLFEDRAWDEYLDWQDDTRGFKRINSLLKELRRHPESGEGQPEQLKHQLSGMWSRRIDREHRLVYTFTDDTVTIASCRYHY